MTMPRISNSNSVPGKIFTGGLTGILMATKKAQAALMPLLAAFAYF
jgi:hypothetical protein